MGNKQNSQQQQHKNESIRFIEFKYQSNINEDERSQKICKFNVQQILNYQLSFLKFLKENKDKEIKVITFVGPTGAGKSTILNLILREFQGGNLKMVFFASHQDEQVTQGIDYYAFDDIKSNKMYIFMDCQGFQGITEKSNDFVDQDAFEEMKIKGTPKYKEEIKQEMKGDINFEIKLTQLLSLICGMSTCVFYVTDKDKRTDKSFKHLLQQIDIEKKENFDSQVKNFVKIINKTAYEFLGDPLPELPEKRNKFEQVFQRQFCLTSFRQQKDSLFLTPLTIETIKQIKNHILNSEFVNPNKWMTSFADQQTCVNFYDIVENAFDIINQGFEESVYNFLEIINIQLKLKQQFREKIEQNKKNSEEHCNKIFEVLKEQISNTHVSPSFCLLLQDFVQQQGFRDIQNQFNLTCDWWKEELENKIKELLQFSEYSDKKKGLLQKYTSLSSIKPELYRIKEKIIGNIKEQEQSNIAKRTKIALTLSVSGSIGVIFGGGVLAESAIITSTLLTGAVILPASLLIGGAYLAIKCRSESVNHKRMKRIKQLLREDLCLQIAINYNNPNLIDQLLIKLITQLHSNFPQLLKNLETEKRKLYIFNLYFNLLNTKVLQKDLQVCQQPDNLNLLEYTMRIYERDYRQANINMNLIFKARFQDFNQLFYTFSHLDQKLTINNSKLQQIVLDLSYEGQYIELISALVVLRNINSYFLIEIMRQHHFKDIIENVKHQQLMIDLKGLKEFFEFQKEAIKPN